MGVKERKEREKENLRQTILDAAGELFVKEGFENVSMRKIAQKIEYSPTTIYLYFKDKDDLFSCLLEDYFLRLKEALQTVFNERDDLITVMKKGMKTYIEFGLNNPNYYQMAFMTNPHFEQEDYQIEGKIGTEVFLGLRQNVTEAIRLGLFQPLDVNLITQVIWTMNHGITSLLISNPQFPWVDQEMLIKQSIESTIKGFLVNQ